MLKVVSCQCGSSDNLIRGKMAKFNCPQAMTIPIIKGKEKSLAALNTLPQFPELNELRAHIEAQSKWAVIIGYDDERLRWVDLANGTYIKNDVDAELLLKHFALKS